MSSNPAPASKGRSAGYTPVNVSYSPREMRVYYLNEAELDSIASQTGSTDIAFLGISAGALITLCATLETVTIADPIKHATFVGAAIVFLVFTLFFGARTYQSLQYSKKRLQQIKKPVDNGSASDL